MNFFKEFTYANVILGIKEHICIIAAHNNAPSCKVGCLATQGICLLKEAELHPGSQECRYRIHVPTRTNLSQTDKSFKSLEAIYQSPSSFLLQITLTKILAIT